MFAGFSAVAIVSIAFKLITHVCKLINHAMDDEDRWRRFISLVAPPLALIMALVVVSAWWLVCDGGLQVVLHGLGPVAAPTP